MPDPHATDSSTPVSPLDAATDQGQGRDERSDLREIVAAAIAASDGEIWADLPDPWKDVYDANARAALDAVGVVRIGASNDVVPPEHRAAATWKLASHLRRAFMGTAGVDLDELASELVGLLVDRVEQEVFDLRRCSYAAAVEAVVNHGSVAIREAEHRAQAAEAERDRLIVQRREDRAAERRISVQRLARAPEAK